MRPACPVALLCCLLVPGSALPREGQGRRARQISVRHRGDPRPLRTRDYLELTVAIDRGRMKVLELRRGRFPKPTAIRRYEGRFQVRLYAHKLLRDLVRFGFPLTAAAGEPTPANIELGRALARGVQARTVVRVPWTGEITRVVLLDTKAGRRLEVDLRKVRPPAIRQRVDGPRRTSIFSPKKTD